MFDKFCNCYFVYITYIDNLFYKVFFKYCNYIEYYW